jgi:hypothetical protein
MPQDGGRSRTSFIRSILTLLLIRVLEHGVSTASAAF